MYSYFLSSEAKEDFRKIYNYGVAQFGINQADKYFDMMDDCFDKIESNPYLFPIADYVRKDFRYCVCGVDTIYYKITHKSRVGIMHYYWKTRFSKIDSSLA